MSQITIHSLVGDLTLFDDHGQIVSLVWGRGKDVPPTIEPSCLLKEASLQLMSYFNKRLQIFDLPLSPPGTEFQKKVCAQMQNIPFGTTRTYGEIATFLKTSARPVGNACGHNPIPIIIPCHRVVGRIGLGGYSGGSGISTKRELLHLEGRF